MESLSNLKGVGLKRKQYLLEMNIANMEDLLFHFPRRYEERKIVDRIEEAMDGEIISLVLCCEEKSFQQRKKNRVITYIQAKDVFGQSCTLLFFNQAYVIHQLKKQVFYVFFGKIHKKSNKVYLTVKDYEQYNVDLKKVNIRAYYQIHFALHQKFFRSLMSQVLSFYTLEENIPDKICEIFELCPRNEAIYHMHLPQDRMQLKKAYRRFIFEEFLLFRIELDSIKQKMQKQNSFHYADFSYDIVLEKLPFQLTDSQHMVLLDMINDFKSKFSMNRLLQGDVGSGKTIVAIIASFLQAKAGYQTVVMAPTEVLAQQLFESFHSVLQQFSISCSLLISSTPKQLKKEIISDCKTGKINVLIGTHAVLNQQVEFAQLSLVIIDEQHKFGVNQRKQLISKSLYPHVLLMSATPIPRTLSFVLYADINISYLDKRGLDRKKIKTFIVNEAKRKQMFRFINKELLKKNQLYIVCPLIDEHETISGKNVRSYEKELRKWIGKDCRVGFLHGRCKATEKIEVMKNFKEGNLDVLVATSLIEVGVNVPNANLLIIENADKFGLAQLHQLRGRIGRSEKQSFCFLMTDSVRETSLKRLSFMKESDDGFYLSNKDLEMRGSGDHFGTKQHGKSSFKLADIEKYPHIFKEAIEAFDYLKTHTSLYEKMKEKNKNCSYDHTIL